jgi:protoporphyrinogen oxidase
MIKFGILGGGIAGLSLLSFLKDKSYLIERNSTFGGLSRSYKFHNIYYDIGPHIIFSKNQEVLEKHSTMISTNKIKRSNQIFFKGRFVKYPFENDLSALDDDDRDYCLSEYLNNPYESYSAANMLQFFLKTFGDGITKLYLQPYNEKIWKFDPSCMDTQMVERIPKPPKEDVIASARGVKTEGYTHQLYYYYPQKGAFQSLINKYEDNARYLGHELHSGQEVISISRSSNAWVVETNSSKYESRFLVNTMPIHELFKVLEAPEPIKNTVNNLLFNSIYIVMIAVKSDAIGDHFAIYLPDQDIIFHRLSKLNYLGESYCPDDGSSVLMAEITFRPNSYLSTLSHDEIKSRVLTDLIKIGFIKQEDVIDCELKYEKYAYVIYDLNHRSNVDKVLEYLASENIYSVGRFAEFEYLNSDGVVEHTINLSKTLNELD